MKKSFLILILSFFCLGATVSYQADYLWTISEISIPEKDLKIYVLDTRQGIVKIFGGYIEKNNLIVKDYAVVEMKVSTNEILEITFHGKLSKAKDKATEIALKYQKKLIFKEHKAGQSIKDWWRKAEIQ